MEQKDLAEIFLARISSSVDRLLATMDGMTQEQINWRPAVENANSIYALAVHTVGYTGDIILGKLCGHSRPRNQEAEFAAVGGSVEPLRMSWTGLRKQLADALAALPAGALDGRYDYGNRNVTGVEVLLILARHAHEHMGHAELTRDLIKAGGTIRPAAV